MATFCGWSTLSVRPVRNQNVFSDPFANCFERFALVSRGHADRIAFCNAGCQRDGFRSAIDHHFRSRDGAFPRASSAAHNPYDLDQAGWFKCHFSFRCHLENKEQRPVAVLLLRVPSGPGFRAIIRRKRWRRQASPASQLKLSLSLSAKCRSMELSFKALLYNTGLYPQFLTP